MCTGFTITLEVMNNAKKICKLIGLHGLDGKDT